MVTSDEIWYREELCALRDMVKQQRASGRWSGDELALRALAKLDEKLTRNIESAPRMRDIGDA